MDKNNLYVETESRKFYNDFYSKEYNERWSIEKKQRVFEIIKKLNLPDYGEALDFGCGNGEFTDIIKKALPQWNISGCDISENAIRNASDRFPGCIFFVNNDEKYMNKKFDFLFSHHVLEHVFDIKVVVSQINERSKQRASMLHIFPCGNPNSYEHNLCCLRNDGINTNMENRFFFEDAGHIRRMTTEQSIKMFEQFNFVLKKDFYSNQYYGAINWISRKDPHFLYTLFNPIKGKNLPSKIKLSGLLLNFLILSSLRMPSILYDNMSQINNIKRKNIFFLSLLYLPARVSKYVDDYIKSLAEDEWNTLKIQKNGSEMYLFFVRGPEKGTE
jgi:SAM-dependent methyltransferase